MIQCSSWDGSIFLRLQFSTTTSVQSMMALGIPLHSTLGGPGCTCWAFLKAMEFPLFQNTQLFCFLQGSAFTFHLLGQ